jgi:Flp pilus assembly protein TadD
LLFVSALVYYPALFYGYFPWDDAAYVRDNPDIRSLSFEHIKLFFSKFYLGNYHPLTMLSFAVDYSCSRGDTFYFHLDNILLHTANACLLFVLLDRCKLNKLICVITTLLFLVSPVQFESVIWIAERKNVLYTFFYLLSVLYFVKQIQIKSRVHYFFALAFFLCALLSKAQAVTLPLALLVVIYFYPDGLKQKITALIPFFVLALVFGILAIYAEQSHGYIHAQPASVLMASYACIQYVLHILLPFKLSVFYSYPKAPLLFEVLSLILLIRIAVLFFYAIKKKYKVVAAVIFLLLSNLILILQFIPVGEAYMADRYAYIPSVIIYFTMVYGCFMSVKKYSWIKFIPVLYCFLILYTALQKIELWKSNRVLLTSSLSYNPDADLLMNVLGSEYLAEHQFTQADSLFDAALVIDATNYQVLYNKATSLSMQKNTTEAMRYYHKTIVAAPTYYPAYIQKAILLINEKEFALAKETLDKVLTIKPDIGKAYFLRAMCFENINDFTSAIHDYSSAITYHYADEQLYINRAICYGKVKDFTHALTDVELVLSKNPANAFAWYLSGIAKINSGKNGCNDLANAYQKGYATALPALQQNCR